jgi:hypothetical protein
MDNILHSKNAIFSGLVLTRLIAPHFGAEVTFIYLAIQAELTRLN